MTRLARVGWALAPLCLLGVSSWTKVIISRQRPARFEIRNSWAPPDALHLWGCADGGIDVATYVAFAIGYVVVLALAVAVLSSLLGTLVGTAASLLGGRVDRWLLRVCDLVQAFPNFLLALAVLSAVQSPRRWHIALVFLVTSWAGFARLAIVMSRQLNNSDFITAARAYGASTWLVLTQHLVPHILGPIAVQMGTVGAGVVLGESALSFVGLGPADGISLGYLIEQGALGMLRGPHVLVVAVVAVASTSGCFQLAAEGIRSWVQLDRT